MVLGVTTVLYAAISVEAVEVQSQIGVSYFFPTCLRITTYPSDNQEVLYCRLGGYQCRGSSSRTSAANHLHLVWLTLGCGPHH